MFLATSVIEARRTCVSKCGGESCIQPDLDKQYSSHSVLGCFPFLFRFFYDDAEKMVDCVLPWNDDIK